MYISNGEYKVLSIISFKHIALWSENCLLRAYSANLLDSWTLS